MLKMIRLLPILIVLSFSNASAVLCVELFPKTYKVNEFIISVGGKKQSEKYLDAAHNNLISNFEISKINKLLKKIKDSGTNDLSPTQFELIFKFRQNTSFLRSIFQTSAKKHKSPTDFADFVRDFGVLKDYLQMNDSNSAKSQARKILKKYSELDFDSLINDTKPASKKSVKKYFKEILNDTKLIMAKTVVTVDDVHDVRKNLRDILRFLQMQNEVVFAKSRGSELLNLNQGVEIQDTPQISFLKKTNSKLGEICDDFAARLLSGQMSTHTIVVFPENIRPRIEHFLEHYQIVGGD